MAQGAPAEMGLATTYNDERVTKMKPTVKNFVRHRLAKMIAKADREGKPLCGMCPGAEGFNPKKPSIARLTWAEDWCPACQKSIGFRKFIRPFDGGCPCYRLKPKVAEEQARTVVKKYAL